MNRINIDHFIELLQRCKEEGCKEIVFDTEISKSNESENILLIMQDDNSVIFSTRR